MLHKSGSTIFSYVAGNPISLIDPEGLTGDVSGATDGGPGSSQSGNCGPGYWERYFKFVTEYDVDLGPYAVAAAGGLWPKSLVPRTGGRRPLLGSKNPLTSVPRALGVPGAGSALARLGVAGIGLATVGIGMYNVTIFAEGFLYAIPDGGKCSCQK